MENATDIDDLKRWNVDILRKFCRSRGLKINQCKKKEELVALAYAAFSQNYPVVGNKDEEKLEASEQYQELLCLNDGTRIPDPLELQSDWLSESQGMQFWPPCMIMNISEYLISNNERPLCTRLRNDYKEGKAFSYFASQESWIKEVFFHKISPDSDFCFLKSSCTPSQRIQQIPHKLWACFSNKTGSVVKAYCTCLAGLGSTCNHVAALLFKVNYAWEHGLTKGCSKPCTSIENRWLAPTLSNVHPVKASDMIIEKPKFRFGTKRKSSVRRSTTGRRLFSTVRSSSDADPLSLDEVAGAMFPECPTAVALRYSHSAAQQQYDPSADFNVELTEECESTSHISADINLLLYAKKFLCATDFVLPVYSEFELKHIEEETRGQCKSPLWFDLRKGRISASIAHEVFTRAKKLIAGKVCDATSVIKLITEGRNVRADLPSLRYGRESEVEAVETYYVVQNLDHENLSVQECGLHIHKELSFLCASPDRIVTCRCCGEGLLEVKCPISCADIDPTKASLPYLVTADGRVMLSRTHQYYTQVQMQMAVTNRQWCDFFIFSKCGYFLERILFDKPFWDVCQSTLETCFHSFVLPSMVASVAPSERNAQT